jgi:hypothetical protein
MMTLKTVASACYIMVLLVFAALVACPANAATLRDVKHIVIILKENHTFDNYFGLFPGADGATVGVYENKLIPLARASVIPSGDFPHLRADALRVWDNDMMDEFNYPSGYAQYSERQIPTYWAYARNYVLADNFFTSVMGPSFPNHLFTIFGTSFGSVDNPRHSNGSSRPSYKWGCDSAPDVLVLMADGSHSRPCWDGPTLIDEILWRYKAEGRLLLDRGSLDSSSSLWPGLEQRRSLARIRQRCEERRSAGGKLGHYRRG